MKKKLIPVIQIAVAVTILTYIFKKQDPEVLRATWASAADNWQYLVGAMICSFCCICFCTLRWQVILHNVDVRLSYLRVLTLYFIGQFFSALIPGVVGGDLPKAIYVAKESHHKKTEVVSTVFIDRIVGLLALIVMAAIIVPLNLDYFLSDKYTKIAMWFVVALVCGATGGLFVVFYKNLFEHIPAFRKLEEKTALGKIIAKVYTSFRMCLNHKSTLVKTLCISFFNHSVMVFTAYLLGQAIGLELKISDYFMTFLIINAVAAIPVAPGGLGTKEAACILLLAPLGVLKESAVTISLLTYFSMFLWSIPGFFVYVVYSIVEGKVDLKAEEAELEQEEEELKIQQNS